MLVRTLLFLLCFSVSLSSVNGEEETPAKDKASPSLSGTWVLQLINKKKLPEKVKPPELTFDKEGKLSGFTGVNRLMGKWDAKADKLFPGPLATTRMAGPPEAMKLETQFSQALSKITKYELKKKKLTLTGKETTLLLVKKKPTKKKEESKE